MTCQVCGDDFERLSFGGPTMPCACGAMVSKSDARDMEPSALGEMKDSWAAKQADEDRRTFRLWKESGQ